MTPLAPLATAFLREHLPGALGRSRHTCEAYAHALRLWFVFAADRHGLRPSQLCLEHLDAALVLDFLAHIEQQRGNAAATRNARLTAVKAFMHYVELRVPALCSRVTSRARVRQSRRAARARMRATRRSRADAPGSNTFSVTNQAVARSNNTLGRSVPVRAARFWKLGVCSGAGRARCGQAIEGPLWASWGGPPTMQMLRHRIRRSKRESIAGMHQNDDDHDSGYRELAGLSDTSRRSSSALRTGHRGATSQIDSRFFYYQKVNADFKAL